MKCYPSMASKTKKKLLDVHRQVDSIVEDIINERKKNLATTHKDDHALGDEDLIDVLLRVKKDGSTRVISYGLFHVLRARRVMGDLIKVSCDVVAAVKKRNMSIKGSLTSLSFT
ncbi:hypothetical protein CQW23_20286 [Capsicum baccatum]|uniref:Uncharacterized protein n=1 Tax=Capsicum baccatum TaxID=33114 RepID=A0A2G2W8B8_CAPBA|nr:hypothetical protein CQW23_20286 [Capsicum baccatum]